MSVLTLWRYTRPVVTGPVLRPFVLPVCRGRIISIEMVILDTLKWSVTAWWVIPAWTILTEPWHRRSCENSNFQNGKLFTFVDSTVKDRRWFKCPIRSSQTRSWDGKLTFWNFFVTEQDVIICFVRINATRRNFGWFRTFIYWGSEADSPEVCRLDKRVSRKHWRKW